MLLAATPDNIHAIMLGATYAVEISKPALCSILTSTAAGLCQTLGYHRMASMKNDNADEKWMKSQTFWSVYVLDKSLSLRLGRASVIQDYDISLPLPSAFGKAVSNFWTVLVVYWIKCSAIQGRLYKQLYSPAALQDSEEIRASTAKEIAADLERAYAEYPKVCEMILATFETEQTVAIWDYERSVMLLTGSMVVSRAVHSYKIGAMVSAAM